VSAPGEGLFVVLEGIDGAGTTTQVERYAARLRAARRPVHVTREPSTGPIGSLIRLALTHRLVFPASASPETLALLFAADRLDHVASEIEPWLREGCVVLSDRYDLSSLTYQSIVEGEPPSSGRPARPRATVEWIRELNRSARRPDVTVVVDVPPEVADARRRARGGARELFDDLELQAKLARAYAEVERFVPGDRVVHVDGSASPDDVAAQIAAALDPIVLGPRGA
jgi:dTMP kinase